MNGEAAAGRPSAGRHAASAMSMVTAPEDAVVSAPANSPPGDNRGRVDVYSGRTGELLWRVLGDEGAQLGVSIEGAHDVDGDDVPDVIAGATGTGKAYVYAGRTGDVIHTFSAPEDAGGFGTKSSGIGDVDGDGHGDLLVGAPGTGQDPEDPGKAYVYSGRDGSMLLELRGQRGGDGYGTSVAGGSQGQRFWLVVGAPSAGDDQKGKVYVYTELTSTPAFVIEPEETASQLGGMFLSMVGDIDDDGVLDVYASDWQDQARGPVDRTHLRALGSERRAADDTGGRRPGRRLRHRPGARR